MSGVQAIGEAIAVQAGFSDLAHRFGLITPRCAVATCEAERPLVRSGLTLPHMEHPIIIEVCMDHFPFLAAWQCMGGTLGEDRRPKSVRAKDAAAMRRRGGGLAAALGVVQEAFLTPEVLPDE